MSTELILLLAGAACAALVVLAIPAARGSESGQSLCLLMAVILAIATWLFLVLALIFATGNWFRPCTGSGGQVGWWSSQRAGGLALAILAAASSMLSIWFCTKRRYVAAAVAAVATVAFATGWIFAAQGITIC